MTTFNEPSAREVLAFISDNIERWDQCASFNSLDSTLSPSTLFDRYSCGTAACIAGWTVLLAGYQVDAYNRVHLNGNLVTRYGRPAYVREMAQELLGLTDYQANKLFIWCGTLESIKSVIDEYSRNLYPGKDHPKEDK